MDEKEKTRFGIDIYKYNNREWNFGICLAHRFEETYVYINFFKWSISIGKLADYNAYRNAALDIAINSLKVDEKYDLLYEEGEDK